MFCWFLIYFYNLQFCCLADAFIHSDLHESINMARVSSPEPSNSALQCNHHCCQNTISCALQFSLFLPMFQIRMFCLINNTLNNIQIISLSLSCHFISRTILCLSQLLENRPTRSDQSCTAQQHGAFDAQRSGPTVSTRFSFSFRRLGSRLWDFSFSLTQTCFITLRSGDWREHTFFSPLYRFLVHFDACSET